MHHNVMYAGEKLNQLEYEYFPDLIYKKKT